MDGTIREHIEIYESHSGPRARIIGHRIRVIDIVAWHIMQGMTIDEMEDNFPTITRADVYAALTYYYDNREEVDAEIARDRDYVQEQQSDHVSPLQERLARLRLGAG